MNLKLILFLLNFSYWDTVITLRNAILFLFGFYVDFFVISLVGCFFFSFSSNENSLVLLPVGVCRIEEKKNSFCALATRDMAWVAMYVTVCAKHCASHSPCHHHNFILLIKQQTAAAKRLVIISHEKMNSNWPFVNEMKNAKKQAQAHTTQITGGKKTFNYHKRRNRDRWRAESRKREGEGEGNNAAMKWASMWQADILLQFVDGVCVFAMAEFSV